MEKKKFEVGCYFDGAFGFYHNAKRIIAFAEQLGWDNLAEELNVIDEIDEDEIEMEVLVETIDELEDWLNDNTLHEENEYWYWSDGDFGLWANCEDCGEQVNKGEGCLDC